MSQDQKRDFIIDAAVKRFAHFGVGKTTMSEIAADLAISKALLYYYFPDKLSLFIAVFQKVTESDDQVLEQQHDPLLAMHMYLEKRTELIVKYHNILEYLKSFALQNIPKELEPVFVTLNQREQKRITSILERGLSAGYLTVKDPKKVGELLYEFLESFRYAFFVRQPNFFPDKKQFQAIMKKEKEFSVIFLQGLGYKSN